MCVRIPVRPAAETFPEPGSRSPVEESKLSSDDVFALLELVPQGDAIDAVVDRRCQLIHQDDKIDDFSRLFKAIIKRNKYLFSGKSIEEKSAVLYNFHSNRVVFLILGELKPIVKEFSAYFKRSSCDDAQVERVVDDAARRKARQRVNSLHSSYTRLVIARALEESVKKIPSATSGQKVSEGQELGMSEDTGLLYSEDLSAHRG